MAGPGRQHCFVVLRGGQQPLSGYGAGGRVSREVYLLLHRQVGPVSKSSIAIVLAFLLQLTFRQPLLEGVLFGSLRRLRQVKAARVKKANQAHCQPLA